jgi:hypothetical protein
LRRGVVLATFLSGIWKWRHLREKRGRIVVVDGGGHFGCRELVLDNFKTSLSRCFLGSRAFVLDGFQTALSM